jgi:hypothetical protein
MKRLPTPRRESDKARPRNQSAKQNASGRENPGRFCVGAAVRAWVSLDAVRAPRTKVVAWAESVGTMTQFAS